MRDAVTPDSDRDAVRDAVRLADLHAAARQTLDPGQPNSSKPQPQAAGEGSPPVRSGGPALSDAPGTILVHREPRPPRPA